METKGRMESDMSEYEIIGKPLPRIDGFEKVTGQAKYTVDMVMPGMLHGKFLRSPHPHARLLSINTEKAKKLRGVKAVITREDVAGIRYAFVDTPRYPADETPLAVDKVRYIGDEVAAVAAIDLETAEEAIRLIQVDYEPLPAVFNSEEAMKPEAPDIHDPFDETYTTEWEDWGVRRDKRATGWKDAKNLSGRTRVAFGDVEMGFAQSDYVREDRFETGITAHCALEPHAALAWFDLSGKLNMYHFQHGNLLQAFPPRQGPQPSRQPDQNPQELCGWGLRREGRSLPLRILFGLPCADDRKAGPFRTGTGGGLLLHATAASHDHPHQDGCETGWVPDGPGGEIYR